MTAPIAALVRRLTADQQTAPDGELLARYATSRDQTAFELLVWRHAGAVWATCRRMLSPDRDAAEDACQATFLALATHAGRLRQTAAVGGWLRTVAVRASLDLQGRKRFQPLPNEPASDSREPVAHAADAELRAALDDGLNRLPDKFRVPFVLCELDGLSNAEAAAVLGCAVGTVESRLARARQRLRTYLTARGVQPAVALGGAVAIPESVWAGLMAVSPESVGQGVRELAVRAVAGGFAVKVRAVVAVGMLLVASAVGFGLMPDDKPAPKPVAKAPDPKPVVAVEPKVPVPEGVLTRLGSPRLRHPAWVTALAFSQDGKRIASVGYDNTILMWDAETGQKLFAIPCEKGETTKLTFAEGGKTLLAAMELPDTSGVMWRIDTVTGKTAARLPLWDVKQPAYVSFSPDGSKVLRVAKSTTAVGCSLLETGTLGPVPSFPDFLGKLSGVRADFSANGRSLLIGQAGSVSLVPLDAKTDAETVTLVSNPKRTEVYDRAILSPDGKTVVARESSGQYLVAFDVMTKTQLARTQVPAGVAMLFARSGKSLVHAGSGFAAGVMEPGATEWRGYWDPKAIRFPSMVETTCAAMHPNGKVVALANTSGTICLFDVATGKPVFPTADPPHEVRHLRYSRDGKAVSAWAADWLSWDVVSGKQTAVTSTGWNHGVPLSPDGKFIAEFVRFSGFGRPGDTESGTYLQIRRADTNQVVHSHKAEGNSARWLDFTPDGKGVIGAGHDGTLRVWSVATGEETVAFKGHPQPPVAHAFSADGKVLVTATRDAPEKTPVRVWDAKTGKELATFGAEAPVLKLAISADGSRIAVAPYTNSAGKPDPRERVTVWDVKAGTVAATVPQGGDGGHVALSPCGRLVAVSARNKPDVRVYEVATAGLRFHFKHKAEITSLAFAPNGRSLAVASLEAPVYLWDIHDGPGEPPAWDGKAVWDDLASTDAATAFAAVRRVRHNPTKAVAFLRDATRLPVAPTAARWRELVAELGAKDFKTRESATTALAEFGEVIRPELDAAIAAATNPEALRRLKALRAKLDIRTADGVRLLRAVEAVEGLDAAEGTPLLTAWASGLHGDRLATEARAALARRE